MHLIIASLLSMRTSKKLLWECIDLLDDTFIIISEMCRILVWQLTHVHIIGPSLHPSSPAKNVYIGPYMQM